MQTKEEKRAQAQAEKRKRKRLNRFLNEQLRQSGKAPPLGKPRRGAEVAVPSTVRIDPTSKALLRSHFKSLGNALYFIARGLAEFNDRRGLTPIQGDEAEAPPVDPSHRPDLLSPKDIETLRACITDRIDRHRGPDSEIAPLIQALRKFERLISPTAPGSPF